MGKEKLDNKLNNLIEDRKLLIGIYKHLSENEYSKYILDNDNDAELKYKLYDKKTKRLATCEKYKTCKLTLCPVCSYFKKQKISKNLKKTIDTIKNQQEENRDFKFITLTVENCNANELSDTLNDIMAAWNRFLGYKDIKENIYGWYRWLEITYKEDKSFSVRSGIPRRNRYPQISYHPHLHIIAYTDNEFVDESTLKSLWKNAMGTNKVTVCIKPITNINGICDYIIKNEYTNYRLNYQLNYQLNYHQTMRIVATLDRVLEHRRIYTAGGIFKN